MVKNNFAALTKLWVVSRLFSVRDYFIVSDLCSALLKMLFNAIYCKSLS